jgi:Inner membrane component of T3SS, cytoplasmic domain
VSDPIRISRDDLEDPHVDQVLAQEAALRGDWADDGEGGEAVGGRVRRSKAGAGRGEGVYVQGVVWTALMGLLGALAGWALLEPSIVEDPFSQELNWALLFVAPAVVAGAATLIAMSDAILSRAWTRALTNGGLGLGIGAVGGMVFGFGAGILYAIGGEMGFGILFSVKPEILRSLEQNPTDLPFLAILVNMSVRAMAWSVFGIPMGLAPGFLQNSRDLKMVGVLGGVVGGFLGGLFFDPIADLFASGAMSRAVGFGLLGGCTGLGIGLVEQLSKDAWLYMEQGPLAGKQFVLYRDPTRIGSSPKCDVYIFKDSEVNPEHAQLRRVGSTHEVEAMSGGTVLVNRKRVSRQRLEDGDEVRIGKAVFRYYVRSKKRKVR